MTIPLGLASCEHIVVEPADCASLWGNDGLLALSTPAMLGHMERTCVKILQPYLPEAMMTVGSSVTLQHLAPTPIGTRVEIHVAVCAVDGRQLTISFEIHDEHEKIGEGHHQRHIVDRTRFEQRLQLKSQRTGLHGNM